MGLVLLSVIFETQTKNKCFFLLLKSKVNQKGIVLKPTQIAFGLLKLKRKDTSLSKTKQITDSR